MRSAAAQAAKQTNVVRRSGVVCFLAGEAGNGQGIARIEAAIAGFRVQSAKGDDFLRKCENDFEILMGT